MMSKQYVFNQNEVESMISRFGVPFFEKVSRDIEVYSDLWNLSSFQLIQSFSANIVFKCHSERFGNWDTIKG